MKRVSIRAVSEEMEARSKRIVETAVELAEQGGFEAVRLRDVASHAGVALGTLYRRFRSKEDLLVAALELETSDLERRITHRPPRGGSALERVTGFFTMATRGLCRRPNLARAMVKAMASGDPELATKVANFHDRMGRLILAALRGQGVAESEAGAPILPGGEGERGGEVEQQLCYALNLVWFGLLVGWSSGLHSQAAMMDHMSHSAELLLLGAEAKG